jgi:hypothetical protein
VGGSGWAPRTSLSGFRCGSVPGCEPDACRTS